MILKGSQRGGAKDLALHLMKDENDHVEVHERRNFCADDLMGHSLKAMLSAEAPKPEVSLFPVPEPAAGRGGLRGSVRGHH